MRAGFIGPIGDDLPSLIPLLFGLMIFFSTFALTFNSFDQKTASFQYDLDALKIAASLRGNNYVYDYPQFKSLCDSIGIQGLNYRAGIALLSPSANETVFNVEFLKDDPNSADANTYACPENPPELKLEGSSTKKIVSKVFPIALQKKNSSGISIIVPARLVVIAWK